MVLRLARALDVPLRERNELLLAAGFAPLYPVEPISSPTMATVERAFAAMLVVHEPFPAVLIDRRWDVQRANDGAVRLFTRLLAPEPMPPAPNVLRLVLEPGPVRNSLRNWHNVAPALLERVRREAVGGVLDPVTRELVADLQSHPDVQRLLDTADDGAPSAPVVDLQFELDGVQLDFFSIVTAVGSPTDVTAQEMRLEAFVPSNEATRDHWLTLSATRALENETRGVASG